MIPIINNVFLLAKERMDYYENILNLIENKPELILTDLFIEETPDNLLAYLVNTVDTNTLIDFQGYLYRLLIPYLKSSLNIDGLDFYFDTENYPTALTIIYNEMPIVDLSIYEKLFIIKEDKNSNNAYIKLKHLEEKLEEYDLKSEDLELSMINPLTMGGSNPFKLMDIALRKKKYKKNIHENIMENENNITILHRQISSLRLQIENLHNDYVEISYIQERISRKFDKLFNYKIINLQSVEES